jgi:very-short-patch-repair endonuclease
VEAVDAVRVCGGAARSARLTRLAPRRGLVTAVATGELLRPVAGLYCLPDCPPDVLAAAAVRGVRSCQSAAVALGLDVLRPDAAPHVTCPPGSRGTWRGSVVHRRQVADLDGCTDVLTTVLDCLRCLPRREALVPADSALRDGRLTLADLHLAAARMNRRDPRRGLLGMADPQSGSALETVARVDLLDQGLRVRTQQAIEPAGRVDLLVEDRLVVEVDGYAFHASARQRSEDLRRDAELQRLGLTVLRFSFEQVVHRRDWWLGVVREVLDQR